jgi:ubiquinone/menaquinone biosynthesis C-methylase UbiE
MLRVSTPEILDSGSCPHVEAKASLRDICRMNRWFGGVSTTRSLITRVSAGTGQREFTVLEVAAGFGQVPRAAGRQLARRGITLDITDLDLVPSHLERGHRALAGNAMVLPFRDNSFDLVSCSLFAHHLKPGEVARFAAEASRVCRRAVLINDLIRHPLHLALAYAAFPLMSSHVSRVDGVASVRGAYVPNEMRQMLSRADRAARIDISRHYLFRMGVVLWKGK